MNILWLSHLVPYPPKAGVLQRSFNLLRELARRHEVHLLAFDQRGLRRATMGEGPDTLDRARKALSEFCADVRVVPIPVDRWPGGKPLLALGSLLTRDPYTVNWLKSRTMRGAVTGWCRSRAFDWVHFDTISLACYRDLVGECRTVLGHHNIESHMMLRRAEQEANRPLAAYFRQEGRRLADYERRLCPRFTRNVTCSPLDSERLRAVCPGLEATDVPNGVDLDYFRPTGAGPEGRRLVFAGTMDWYPNRAAMTWFAAEVWPRLKRAVPDVEMDVVGANPPEVLRRVAASDPAFRVTGFVDDVRPYLEGAAVYVCPIRDGGGTKLKVLDALAMHKALVAHPVACEGIDVTPGQDVVLAETPEEYVDAVRRLLDDPAERARLGKNGRALVERAYGYDVIGRRFAALFEGP